MRDQSENAVIVKMASGRPMMAPTRRRPTSLCIWACSSDEPKDEQYTQYTHVHPSKGKWRVRMRMKGYGNPHRHFGVYESQLQAVHTADRVCYKLGKDLQVGLTEQEKAELNKLTLDELLEIIDREQGIRNKQVLRDRSAAKETSSSFLGISKESPSWRTKVSVQGKVHSLGQYKDKLDAVRAADRFCYKVGMELQLGLEEGEASELDSMSKEEVIKSRPKPLTEDSKILRRYDENQHYTHLTKINPGWRSRVTVNGESINLGSYADERQAVHAADRVYYKQGEELQGTLDEAERKRLDNMSLDELLQEFRDVGARKQKATKMATSIFLRVFRKNDSWGTRVIFNDKQYYCGSYNSEQEAAEVADYAGLLVHGSKTKLNFPKCHRDYQGVLEIRASYLAGDDTVEIPTEWPIEGGLAMELLNVVKKGYAA